MLVYRPRHRLNGRSTGIRLGSAIHMVGSAPQLPRSCDQSAGEQEQIKAVASPRFEPSRPSDQQSQFSVVASPRNHHYERTERCRPNLLFRPLQRRTVYTPSGHSPGRLAPDLSWKVDIPSSSP